MYTQRHGFSNVSESASLCLQYACAVYLHMLDASGSVYSSLVITKMKVTPIKRLTVPWLELYGTCLLAELLYIVWEVLQLPSDWIFAWTDSAVVLSLLRGNPWWFKTYVANCVSQVFEILPPDCWRHVDTSQNWWTVHPQVCTHMNFIIILYGGNDLIGWSSTNLNGPASHMLLFILCHKKRKLCLYTFEQEVNHLSYHSHSIQISPIWSMLPPGFSASSTTVKLKSIKSLNSSHSWPSNKFIILRHTGYLLFNVKTSLRKLTHYWSIKYYIPQLPSFLCMHLFRDSDGLLSVWSTISNSTVELASKHPVIVTTLHS